VLGNDTDADNNSLTAALVVAPAHGSLTLNANGSFVYTPAANYNGSDSFTYKANDGQVDSNVATVTLSITAVDDPPVATNDSYTTAEDTPLVVPANGVLGNDTDVEGDTLTAILVSGPSHGSVALNANGGFTYTPAANYNGSDSFTYKANDGQADSNVASVLLTISAVNDAPVANAQSVSTNEDTAKAIALTASDVDGDALTFSIVAGPTHGALSGTPPNVTYTPSANYNGADSFTFKANDSHVDSNVATVSITVIPVNDAPVANAQSVSTNEDTAKAITLAATDVDGDALTYSIVTGPAHGTLSGTAPNVTYTPAANYNGADSFTFKANDSHVDSNVAAVSITVIPVNDPPVANAQNVSTNEDTAKAITLTASDVEGDALTFSIVAGPTHGSLSGTAPNVTYTPAANYNGADSFTFKANDGQADSNVATVSITVVAVNDPPVANAQNVSTNEDTAKAITLAATDVDGDTLTYSIVTGPAHGAISGTLPNVTYTPAANYNGGDSFTFKANDGHVDSTVATVSVTIAAVNDAPSFVAGANQTAAQDAGAQTVTGWATGISAGPADESGQTLNFIIASNTNAALFSAQPAVAANGTLTYTSAAGATGTATIGVQLHDNGGTANGGVDTSAVQTFTITVNAKPALSVANTSVVEGNGGCTAMNQMPFTVTLSPASSQAVTVNYQTLNGTASGDATCGNRSRGYIITTGTLTFAAGETSKVINVPVVGDTAKESNQTFALRLSNATNATLPASDAIGTIIDDDSTPHFTATSTSSSTIEGNTGTKTMLFAVAPTNENEQPMTVDFTTIAGPNARENIDYLATGGTLVFPPYTSDPQFVAVTVVGNLRHQQLHKFFVHLLNAVAAIVDPFDAEGDIVDDDPIPTISISDVTVGEANSGTVNAVLNVTLSNDSDDVVTVNYTTTDGSAIGGSDFVPQNGTLTFQPGQTSQVITIAINPAVMGELTEQFTVNLSAQTNSTIAKASGVVTITPPTSWVTTTVNEFGTGTVGAGAYLANTSGGEVSLAPTVGAEFAGTTLPSGWTSTVLSSGGSATVANGLITVDGDSVLSPTTFAAGHTLEFVATFTGQDQNAGFGLTSALLPPFAMFGVKADGQLYARSVAPGQAFETAIPGSWLNAPHRFRIDWNASTVVYWVDGAQKLTHTITYKGTSANMRPAITDLTTDGRALTVDWMRMSAYASSGVYVSPVYDAAAAVAWQRATWSADAGAGNNVVVEVRTGSTATPDGSWTSFAAVTNGGALTANARYAQYRITLTTSVANTTPAVKEVVLTFLR